MTDSTAEVDWDDPGDIAEWAWEFDTALRDGHSPNWDWYLSRCATGETRAKLLIEMVRSEQGHRGWYPQRVKERIQDYADLGLPSEWLQVLARSLYADQLETNHYPAISDFELPGIDGDPAALGLDGDPLVLGSFIDGRYQVLQRVGQGGYGTVYRAKDLKSGNIVAVKAALKGQLNQERLATAILVQESDALRSLRHPSIPALYETVQIADGPFCMIREFVEGQSLGQLIAAGPVSPERAARLIVGIAETIHYAHRCGFVYRDLSPDNVLVNADDRIYLMDFGVAVTLDDQRQSEIESAGTQGYMSLENLLGLTGSLDGTADVWGLGVLLLALVKGSIFELAEWPLAPVLLNVVSKAMTYVHTEHVPQRLLGITAHCFGLEPTSRHITAAALAEELKAFIRNESCVELGEKAVERENRLFAWRVGCRFGSVTHWHSISQAIIAKAKCEDVLRVRDLCWVISHCLGFAIASFDHKIRRVRGQRPKPLNGRLRCSAFSGQSNSLISGGGGEPFHASEEVRCANAESSHLP